MLKLEESRDAWLHLDEVDSTNNYLSQGDFPSGTVCLARSQTGGRGQRGRVWNSLPGDSFIFSALLNANMSVFPQNRLSFLPLLLGLSVLKGAQAAHASVAEGSADLELLLKWPNDVYLMNAGKAGKLAGILVETDFTGKEARVIMGVGLNWRGTPELLEKSPVPPASLFAGGADVPDAELLTGFLVKEYNKRIGQLYQDGVPAFFGEIRELFYLSNKTIQTGGESFQVLGLMDDGGLRLKNVSTGEFRLIYETLDDLKVLE